MTRSLTCQHLCHQQGSRCRPRLFPTKQDPRYSPTKDTDLQRKFNRAPPFRPLRSYNWQSNHYKVRTFGGGGGGGRKRRRAGFSPRQTRSLALSEGVPAGGQDFGSLISVRVSEAVKCGGQTQTMGKGTNGRAITELQAELHFKRGQMAFSSLPKALG